MKKNFVRFAILALAVALQTGCTGSGAVTPLSPSRASTPEASNSTETDVIYWSNFPVTFGLTDPLNDVCLTAKKSGWACGNNGIVLKYDGETWAKIDTGYAKNENLMALAFASETEGWAVGTHGTILYYNNGSWSQQNSQSEETLYDVAVTRSRTVWVAGANGTLLRYNGISWGQNVVTQSGVTVKDDIYGLGLTDQNNGWAVGNRGLIIHYDGQNWVPYVGAPPTTERLNSVSAISDVQAWIVGAFGTILQYNGTTWNKMGSAFSGFDLYRIFMLDDSNGWAVGQDGTLIYYDGTRWISHVKPEGKPALNGITFYKNNLGFIVGQNGTILKFSPNGEPAKYSFLFKGEAKKPTKKISYWTIVYSFMNQSPKTSPPVTFEVSLPRGFEPYVSKETPTPIASPPAWLTNVTPTPTQATFTPTPKITIAVTPGSPTPVPPPQDKVASTVAGTWTLKDNVLDWEIGTVLTSELKTLTIPLQTKKGEKKVYPVVLRAILKTNNDKVIAEAVPVTMLTEPPAEAEKIPTKIATPSSEGAAASGLTPTAGAGNPIPTVHNKPTVGVVTPTVYDTATPDLGT